MINEILKCTKELKLLYVEDDKLIQSAYGDLFSSLFSSVLIADDGIDALEKYKNGDFDLIISDIRMPNMSGTKFIREIRKTDKDIAVIIYSAWNDLEKSEFSDELNISGYMTKPIQTDSMLEIFKKVLC